MVNLTVWAIKWGVPHAAIDELRVSMGLATNPANYSSLHAGDAEPGSESRQQSLIRLEAGRLGMRLWRNNVGVLPNPNGQPVRYGLANDNAQMNKAIKSSDLIGWRTIVVSPDMVGHAVAIFTSIECKEAGWHYTGSAREKAQKAWIDGVIAAGGQGGFATGPGSL